jgi:hypothetical protein
VSYGTVEYKNLINIINQCIFVPTTSTFLRTDQPFLQIEAKSIINNIASTIRKHSREIEIQEYLCTKNKWTPTVFHTIMWKAHGHALQQFTGRTRQILIQFVHNWLPCNTSYSLQFMGQGRLCPICNSHEETQLHFISCEHSNIQIKWETAALNINERLLL